MGGRIMRRTSRANSFSDEEQEEEEHDDEE